LRLEDRLGSANPANAHVQNPRDFSLVAQFTQGRHQVFPDQIHRQGTWLGLSAMD
jgi:hypothetical protein